ncbi:TRAP transporter fused permease subunit [Pelagibius litoralis]|uniref:TRAP transporter fused permease subunit n=2 Tax=Pelagibius litoralis TaxID=374515 RepID=A0A967C677_9PROT|nr:TRAP transporter fused permease subunit [Pelagibius litoralis]
MTAGPDDTGERGLTAGLSGPVRAWIAIASALSVTIAVWIMFGLGHALGLYVPLETEYLYCLIGLLLPLVFLINTVSGQRRSGAVPFYDGLLAAAAFGIPITFAVVSDAMLNEGWEYTAPPYAKVLSYVMWALVLEALRRSAGMTIFVICAVISLYPFYADWAPGLLRAQSTAFDITAGYHIFGSESILGVPMNAFATLVIGFLIFGVALQYTGGGAFFLNLAFALLGTHRGGPGKVAIFSSGLMGSMSGSVITNVLTTGVMSIPAMKRVGFKPAYAGGVEACASTGGVLMPPVMGATAFVMATFIEMPYSEIVLAAAIPSLLYYAGLFLQIDAYAARHGIKGLPAEELPSVRTVMKEGWYFIAVFALLVFMLLYLQREAQAPFYASLLLIVINQISPRHRWDRAKLIRFVQAVGTMLAELAALLAGVGLIIGALTLSGKVGSIAYELVAFAGDNIFLLLVTGAVTSFILGMGMTVTAAYIFLAVTLAPALTTSGLDLMAVHLFMLYWGMVSFITPPVSLGAFAAASIARSDPMKTGLQAMRLGSIIYFLPFFFVLNPALIGRGPAEEVLMVVLSAFAGIVLIAGGLQGYLLGFGVISGGRLVSLACRILLILSGIALALPGNATLGLSHSALLGGGAVLFGLALALAWIARSPRTA